MGALERETAKEVLFRDEAEASVWVTLASHHGASRADELLLEYRKRRAKLDDGKGRKP